MPDIDTGKVSLGYDLPKNISFFIEDSGAVSGPFNATKDDDDWFLTTSTVLTPLIFQRTILRSLIKAY
jgi:hypothetical protein